MERIAGPEVALSLDTAELEAEMIALVAQTRAETTSLTSAAGDLRSSGAL